MSDSYQEFLRSKVRLAASCGVSIQAGDINPALKPHQAAAVRWNVEGGRRADFLSFGLGKSVIQLETLRVLLAQVGGRALIVCPLGVRQEFVHDAREILGWEGEQLPRFIRRIEEAAATGIYLTNYETVRDGKLDPKQFTAVSLDEASILRGFGGSKTFREFMRLCTGDAGPTAQRRRVGAQVPYRFVATATPSPNDYIELLAYADFLGVMDVSQAKTRFFKRDSTKADVLTLHPHKEREFWLWVASWALFVQRPSDLGFSDEGYNLPALDVRWHEVPTDHRGAGAERSGQGKLFRDAAIGIQDAAAEKRLSLDARLSKLLEIRAEDPAAHRILWHDLERERAAIEAAVPGAVSVYGSQDLDEREDTIAAFSRGEFAELSTKPVLCGSGCNFQRYCAWAVYLGIGFKFNDFIQSIHRLQRFLQTRPVRVDIIYTEAEREVRKQLERKWQQHNQMVSHMTTIIKEFGLSQAAMAQTLARGMGVQRVEAQGEGFRLVNNDCVEECRRLPADSVGLILTSIPFSTQYEYSPNYADFGHSDNNEEFFRQMDFLIPELLRVLQPGRVAAVHVKDRIVPGGMTGLGFQTVYPFHVETLLRFQRHGFAYMGMKTITTDVVRENNQTYRLSYTEQCKDASKMGCGMPEYLLLFRKPQSDAGRGYADLPVVKQKDAFSLHRWQVYAAGYDRSGGNRPLAPEDLAGLNHEQMFKLWRAYNEDHVYNLEAHVALGDTLRSEGKLPVTFALFPAHSNHPDVWSDITRMQTLNGAQSAKGKEMHLCPMQFDLADRVIEQFSMPGETVLDPFGGLMTVPYRAVLKRRVGVGVELNPTYFLDGVGYCRRASEEMAVPCLFDLEALA